jgi:Leucine-rich repeat (LRR) protein
MVNTNKIALKRIQEAKKKNSESLILDGLNLTKFPEEILELTNLSKLDLTGNQIE